MFYLIIILALAFYYYSTRNHNYWSKRKVKHDPPIPLFGNISRILTGKKSVTEVATELYYNYPEELVVGLYKGITPVLLIRDIDVAHDILTTNFSSFYIRGVGRDPKAEPLFDNILHGEGDKWKLLRQRLTRAFTVAKMKRMFPLIKQCTLKFEGVVDKIIEKGGDYDVHDLMARYLMEVIAVCVFGIKTDSMSKENSLFVNMTKWIFERPLKNLLIMGLWELFPEIRGTFRIANPRIDETIYAIINSVREQRNYKPSGRNDLIDIMLELEAMGTITGESIERKNPDNTPVPVEMEIDMKSMAAHMFVFFTAGYETSATSTSFALHQLAFHPKIQSAIQNEIDTVLSKYDNELNYEAIAEMRLLDMTYKESLRLFPPVGVLHRVCTKPYVIPKLGVTIDPGVKVIIPVQAIHIDQLYYENPKEFRPERFNDSQQDELMNKTFLPFSIGPRNCIAGRLGYLQSMAGLAAVLHKYTVEPSAQTQYELEVDHKKNIVQGIVGGLPLRIKRRTK